jgi:hypothetical protein
MPDNKEHIDIKVSEDDFPSKEKIWDKLYQCRDFELSHFWQKSVFLFTLVSLCFTGYGALALKVVDEKITVYDLLYLYQYMSGVSVLGIVLSVIWIYMMKGSKAWVEVYENTIYEIESEIFSKKGNGRYVMGKIVANNKSADTNCSFLGVNAGAFSPSKINILIGWLIFGVWIICSTISFYNLLFCYCQVILKNDLNGLSGALISVFIVLVISILAIKIPKEFIISKPLSKAKYNFKHTEIFAKISQIMQ